MSLRAKPSLPHMKTSNDPDVLHEWAALACARREYSPLAMKKKLLTWGATEIVAEELLSQLLAEGFLSEERFARAYWHDQSSFAHWGAAKILYHLRYQHGISAAVLYGVETELAAQEKVEAELDVLIALILPRVRKESLPLSAPVRAKLARFAYQKGYSYEQYQKALQRALKLLETENSVIE